MKLLKANEFSKPGKIIRVPELSLIFLFNRRPELVNLPFRSAKLIVLFSQLQQVAKAEYKKEFVLHDADFPEIS